MSQVFDLRCFGLWSVETVKWEDDGFKYSETIWRLAGLTVRRHTERWTPGFADAMQSIMTGGR